MAVPCFSCFGASTEWWVAAELEYPLPEGHTHQHGFERRRNAHYLPPALSSQIPITHVHHHRRKLAKSLSLVSCPSTIPSCHRFRDHCQPFPLSPLPHLLELPPQPSPRLHSRPSKTFPRRREPRTLSLMLAILHQTKASLILCLPTLPQPHNRPHPLDPRHWPRTFPPSHATRGLSHPLTDRQSIRPLRRVHHGTQAGL